MMQIYYLCECINNNSIELMLQFLKLLVWAVSLLTMELIPHSLTA